MDEQQQRDQLSRMDVKLDVLLAQHGHLSSMVADHEARMRLTETAQAEAKGVVTGHTADIADHEVRLRASDRWRYALPATVIGVLAMGAGNIINALKGH
jgi:hypothetical protein